MYFEHNLRFASDTLTKSVVKFLNCLPNILITIMISCVYRCNANMQSIKADEQQIMDQMDDAEFLKAQLKIELQNIKQCTYKVYECTQLTLDGYNYCLRHILNDKNAPYKQCSYVYNTNGKRCFLPAPKDKKEWW